MLAVSIISEYVFAILGVPEFVWRLLCIRYLFLIFLGMMWAEKGFALNSTRIILIVISLLAITIFSLTETNTSPLFVKTISWKQFHWICYFYVAFAIPTMLWWLKRHSPMNVNSIICILGKYSWEIFLVQMVIFKFTPREKMMCILGEGFGTFVFVIFTITASILPILLYKKYSSDAYYDKTR